MPLELLFLGTGTSAGVPMIGCGCGVCHSHDPRDQRTRPSVLVRYPIDHAAQRSDPPTHDTAQFLIDTAPEMRTQLIRHDIARIDGVFYTHTHADHVFGIDDLRRFNAVMKTPIPIYAEPVALDALRRMFGYIFEPHTNKWDSTFVPNLIPHPIEAQSPVTLLGARWTPIRLLHGRRPILGYRIDLPTPPGNPGRKNTIDTHSPSFGGLAYCTDVSSVPPETYPQLENLDVLVIDALRYRHHPTHLTVDQALAAIEQIKPRRAYLTHIAHDIQHADLEAKLPQHVFLAFDGLTVEVATTPTHQAKP